MFRISRNKTGSLGRWHPGNDVVTDVPSVDQIEPAIRSSLPGRYHVDEITRDALPSGHTSRRWGVGIRRADGVVTLEPDPWPRRTDDTIDRSPWNRG